jgi:hypothetical protein
MRNLRQGHLTEHDLKKQSQFSKCQMIVNFFVTKDYEKELRLWAGKTNANKANLEPTPMPAPASTFGANSAEFAGVDSVKGAVIRRGHLRISRMYPIFSILRFFL